MLSSMLDLLAHAVHNVNDPVLFESLQVEAATSSANFKAVYALRDEVRSLLLVWSLLQQLGLDADPPLSGVVVGIATPDGTLHHLRVIRAVQPAFSAQGALLPDQCSLVLHDNTTVGPERLLGVMPDHAGLAWSAAVAELQAQSQDGGFRMGSVLQVMGTLLTLNRHMSIKSLLDAVQLGLGGKPFAAIAALVPPGVARAPPPRLPPEAQLSEVEATLLYPHVQKVLSGLQDAPSPASIARMVAMVQPLPPKSPGAGIVSAQAVEYSPRGGAPRGQQQQMWPAGAAQWQAHTQVPPHVWDGPPAEHGGGPGEFGEGPSHAAARPVPQAAPHDLQQDHTGHNGFFGDVMFAGPAHAPAAASVPMQPPLQPQLLEGAPLVQPQHPLMNQEPHSYHAAQSFRPGAHETAWGQEPGLPPGAWAGNGATPPPQQQQHLVVEHQQQQQLELEHQQQQQQRQHHPQQPLPHFLPPAPEYVLQGQMQQQQQQQTHNSNGGFEPGQLGEQFGPTGHTGGHAGGGSSMNGAPGSMHQPGGVGYAGEDALGNRHGMGFETGHYDRDGPSAGGPSGRGWSDPGAFPAPLRSHHDPDGRPAIARGYGRLSHDHSWAPPVRSRSRSPLARHTGGGGGGGGAPRPRGSPLRGQRREVGSFVLSPPAARRPDWLPKPRDIADAADMLDKLPPLDPMPPQHLWDLRKLALVWDFFRQRGTQTTSLPHTELRLPLALAAGGEHGGGYTQVGHPLVLDTLQSQGGQPLLLQRDGRVTLSPTYISACLSHGAFAAMRAAYVARLHAEMDALRREWLRLSEAQQLMPAALLLYKVLRGSIANFVKNEVEGFVVRSVPELGREQSNLAVVRNSVPKPRGGAHVSGGGAARSDAAAAAPPSRDARVVAVTHVPAFVTGGELREVFGGFGEVEEATPARGRSPALARFKEVAAVEKALRCVDSQRVRVAGVGVGVTRYAGRIAAAPPGSPGGAGSAAEPPPPQQGAGRFQQRTLRDRSGGGGGTAAASPRVPASPPLRGVGVDNGGGGRRRLTPMGERKVWVGDLPPGTRDSDLKAAFEAAGEVEAAVVTVTRRGSRAPTTGFVLFRHAETFRKVMGEAAHGRKHWVLREPVHVLAWTQRPC